MRGELEAYEGGLAEKPEVTAINKIDAMTAEDLGALIELFVEATGIQPLTLSGAAGTGVKEVVGTLMDQVRATRGAEQASGAAAQREPSEPAWTP